MCMSDDEQESYTCYDPSPQEVEDAGQAALAAATTTKSGGICLKCFGFWFVILLVVILFLGYRKYNG